MKKVVALLLVFTMLLVLLPASALAAESSGTCGENVQWSLSGGKLTISGSGSMYDYDVEAFSPYPWPNKGITTVVIQSGVTSIGDWAFSFCSDLTDVTIPDSVTSIGESAFMFCSSLTNVTIPDSVTNIAGSAFDQGCSSLVQIDVAAGNPRYSSLDGLLMNKDGTELLFCPRGKKGNYTIPSGVTTIDIFAFMYCYDLTSITIPDGVTTIGSQAFDSCHDLTSVTIPRSVISIGDWAFADCTSLTIYGYQGTVAEAYARGHNIPFVSLGFADAETPNMCGENVQWTLSGGTLTISGSGSMYDYNDYWDIPWYENREEITSVVIQSGVTSIGNAAFRYCTSLTGITIPDSVTSIGVRAFSGCTSLTSITIPASVTEIGKYTFHGCTNLTNITIPDSVTRIDWLAFYECTSLSSITIPNSVTSIGGGAFSDCTNLTSITIPDSVTVIGDMAFRNCTSLTSITIPRSVTGIGEDVFAGCDSLTIYGYQGTEAEDYAHANSIPFVSLGYRFTDLVEGKFYYTPVLWAVKNDITSGVNATEFAPNQDCTRAQVVTFLWRAMGSPEPQGKTNPFADVKSDRFYSKAVLWAAENNITSGVDANHFAPNKTVSRGEFVTFLWRAMGKPASSGGNPFGDVAKGKFYHDAVLWAAGAGITTGAAPGAFRPSDVCTRGQVVTFLYRAFGE